MAITLLDAASLSQKPLQKAILMAMFQSQLPSPVEQLNVKGVSSLGARTVRLTDGGSPSTRNIGDAVAAYQAKFSDREETLKIIENKVTIDKVLLEIKDYIQDPLALQMKTYALVVKNTINDLLINGDPTVDPTQPAGLHFRLNNDAIFSGQSVNAAGLNVDASDANRLQWLDYIDETITLCNGGNPQVVVVNRQTWIKFRSALRALKLLDTTRDQFDRVIMQYGDTKIINAGQKPANILTPAASGQVIGDDTQTSIFGTASTTPMYFLQTSGEDAIELLQLHPLRVTKVGLDTTNPGQYVVDVTWPVGFSLPQRFCVASLQGLDIT